MTLFCALNYIKGDVMKGILVESFDIEDFEDSSNLFVAINKEIVLNPINLAGRKLVMLQSLTTTDDIFPTQKHFDDLVKRVKRRGIISILNFYMGDKTMVDFGPFIVSRKTKDYLNVTVGLYESLKCVVGYYYDVDTLIEIAKEIDSFEADIEYELIYSEANIVEIQVFLNIRQVTCKGRDNEF